MKTHITDNTAEAISRFMESSGIVVFFILVGIIIMAGTFYVAKLWYDIKDLRKRLENREPDQDTQE